MAAHDAVGAMREAVNGLAAAVQRVAEEYGDTLGVRRLTSDVERLGADLDELGGPLPGHRPGASRSQLLEIPDDPYDESMWAGAESDAQHVI